MNRNLPKPLVIGLLICGLASFALCLFLERKHLSYLDQHPIMTNLLSGVVGFSFASLLLTVGFNWFMQRDRVNRIRLPALDAWSPILRHRPAQIARSTDDPYDAPIDDVEEQEAINSASELIEFHFPMLIALLELDSDFLISRHLRALEEQLQVVREYRDAAIYDQLNEMIHNFIMRVATSQVGEQVGLPRPHLYEPAAK
jgi:hypothetical protein